MENAESAALPTTTLKTVLYIKLASAIREGQSPVTVLNCSSHQGMSQPCHSPQCNEIAALVSKISSEAALGTSGIQ